MSLGSHKEYNAAVAFLNFRRAYKELVRCTKELPDLDVTEAYPFFLLDFETIEPNVLAWASIHASRLLDSCPDVVDNPACLDCEHFGIGIGADGMCKGSATKGCNNYPKILFDRRQCMPVLVKAGIYKTDMSDNDVYLLYVQEVLKHGKAE